MSQSESNSKKMLSNKRKRSHSTSSKNNSIKTDKSKSLSKSSYLSKNTLSKNSKTAKRSYKKRSSNQSNIIQEEPNFEEKLIKQALTQKPQLKANCTICGTDSSSNIRIIGKSLSEYCLECLISLKVKENYHIVDKLNFPIFNSDWTIKEELQLIGCIEKFGLDNWGEIASSIKSKPKLPCESHFYTYYCKKIHNALPSTEDVILHKTSAEPQIFHERNKENQKKEEEKRQEIITNQGMVPELMMHKDNKNNNRSRLLVKNRNRKDQKNVTSAEEIVGYWPKREEFDVEFLNEAEIEIAELEFLDDDTPEDTELKLNVLKIYNMHLAEREARKK